ncbi:MAG: glycosyltransferase family 4 protein, partial [Candidatus Gracilibacteria bacterium]|nr:glycosyltransferase family 4 protein [Candidatus Gracilibacteria bacterium]
MKKAILISESTVYKGKDGKIISRGGGEVYMHNLAKFLLKLGVGVTVFGIKEFDDQVAQEVIEGVVYERCGVFSRKSFGLFGYLRRAVKKAKEYDFVFVNQFVPHLVLPFVKGKKKVAIIHDVYKNEGIGFWISQYGFFVGIIGFLVERVQLFFDGKYSDVIMTVSEGSKKKIIRAIGEKAYKKVVICPSVIRENSGNSEIANFEKENMLLFVGRFVDYKHPEHVLSVLKKIREIFPDFRAVFVVPRVEEKTIAFFEDERRRIGIANDWFLIKRCGGDDEVAELMIKAKLLVQPSFIEGQGIVILEALMAGTPVIAYDLEAYEGML